MGESGVVEAYLRAKDDNRPGLMKAAFAPGAELEMVVRTDAISFPPSTRGLAAITEVLVTRFNETYADVRTLCLSAPPAPGTADFSCPWLVGMTERASGAIRVGCGRYDWGFKHLLADRLRITIEAMEVLPAGDGRLVREWLASLPYPWCPAKAALAGAPPLEALAPILRRLESW